MPLASQAPRALRPSPLVIALAACAAGLALTGCGGGDAVDATGTAAPTPTGSAPIVTASAAPAPAAAFAPAATPAPAAAPVPAPAAQGGAAPTPPAPAPTATTPSRTARAAYYADGGKLRDPCGEELVMRGVNKMAVFEDRSGESFPGIAETGANTVRIMWLGSVPASEAVQTLQRAVDNRLVPVLELHDATGDWSRMPQVEAFWTAPATVAVLRQFENRMIVNLANEPGTDVPDEEIVTVHGRIVRKLREAGLRMPLMVTASGYGRDVEQMLRVAPRIQAADPLRNMLFDWHVYDGDSQMPTRIENAIRSAQSAAIPLVMGEFGGVVPGACSQVAPWRSVLSLGQRYGVGWMAWSWDNMNGDCQSASGSAFDMVGDGRTLATLKAGWARSVVLDDPNSIRNTARRTSWQTLGRCPA